MASFPYRKILSITVLLTAIGTVATLLSYRTPMVSPSAEFAGVSLRIDYATTESTREQGLGGRTIVPNDYGMLFVFPKDAPYGFWMKDMLVPIDIFWLDSSGKVISSVSDVAPSSYPDVFYPTGPARYVLETAAGFRRAHSVATGTPLLLKNFPSVSE